MAYYELINPHIKYGITLCYGVAVQKINLITFNNIKIQIQRIDLAIITLGFRDLKMCNSTAPYLYILETIIHFV